MGVATTVSPYENGSLDETRECQRWTKRWDFMLVGSAQIWLLQCFWCEAWYGAEWRCNGHELWGYALVGGFWVNSLWLTVKGRCKIKGNPLVKLVGRWKSVHLEGFHLLFTEQRAGRKADIEVLWNASPRLLHRYHEVGNFLPIRRIFVIYFSFNTFIDYF